MESTLLYGVSWLRSSLFTAESLMLPLAEALGTKKLPRLPFSDFSLFLKIQRSLHQLLRQDAERIAQGYYPSSVLLRSEPAVDPISHLQRLPRIFREAMDASRRREKSAPRNLATRPPAAKVGSRNTTSEIFISSATATWETKARRSMITRWRSSLRVRRIPCAVCSSRR